MSIISWIIVGLIAGALAKWLMPGKDGDSWIGGDCTINMNNSDQLSLFYGSQKGGLVCANGSCVIQPDFDEGIKLTYRTSF